jgi:hypothetical protein
MLPLGQAVAERRFVGYYGVSCALGGVTNRAAIAARVARSRTPERLCVYDTLLQRLAQDLEDLAAELGEFIQAEHAMVGQRHFARHRHVAPADHPRIREGVMGARTGGS